MLKFFTLEKFKWILTYGCKPIIEIFIIFIIVYMIANLVRGTRTAHLLKGLVIIIIVFFLAQILSLHTITWILTKIFAFSMIAFLIIFQPELRRALTKLGQNPFFVNLFREEGMIEEIIKAVDILSKKRIGVLLIIEQNVGLKNYVEGGISLDAKISSEFLVSMFMPVSPLHDGAAIIQGERITAAGCLLPLTENPNLAKTIGTRHRAAMGITEESDAVGIVVSEETGIISLVIGGKITRHLESDALKKILAKTILKHMDKKDGI